MQHRTGNVGGHGQTPSPCRLLPFRCQCAVYDGVYVPSPPHTPLPPLLLPCRRLLLEDAPQDEVELASDALQPLLCCDPATYTSLAQQLVAAQAAHDPAAAHRIHDALGGLLATQAQAGAVGGGSPGVLSRQSKRAFRQALCRVVADVRALTRVR